MKEISKKRKKINFSFFFFNANSHLMRGVTVKMQLAISICEALCWLGIKAPGPLPIRCCCILSSHILHLLVLLLFRTPRVTPLNLGVWVLLGSFLGSLMRREPGLGKLPSGFTTASADIIQDQ